MKKLILLGAVLAGTAHAQQTFYTDQYGQPMMTAIQVGNQTFFTDRYGSPIGTAIQQPAYQPQGSNPYYYTPDNPSPYTPDSIVQEQRREQRQRYYGN